MRRLIIVATLLAALFVGVAVAHANTADNPCEGYAECIDTHTYDTAGAVPGTPWAGDSHLTIAWVDSHTIGSFWWARTEYGLMALTGDNTRAMFEIPGHLSASFNLTAGTYRVVGVHGGDGSVVVNVKFTNTLVAVNDASIWSQGNYATDIHEFVLDRAAYVTVDIEVNSLYDFGPHYFTSLGVVKVSNAYPTVPAGTPTLAPNATPAPVATEYCQPSTTGNLASPTATPVPGAWPGTFSLVEDFSETVLRWIDITATGSDRVDWINHTSTSPLGAYGIDWSDSGADLIERPGLAYVFDTPMTNTIYLDGWAYVLQQDVAVGTTVYVDVLKEESGTWAAVQSFVVSAGRWGPFHVAISPNVGTIAIVAHRSDDSTTGSIVVDDLYLYDALNLAKYCNGLFPDGSLNGNGGGQYDNQTDTTELTWPANKPCPPNISAPDNFWGRLMVQLTLFLDNALAWMPLHEPGSLSELAYDMVASPAVTFASLTAVFIDFRVMLIVLGLLVVFESGRVIVTIYKFIKGLIPFL